MPTCRVRSRRPQLRCCDDGYPLTPILHVSCTFHHCCELFTIHFLVHPLTPYAFSLSARVMCDQPGPELAFHLRRLDPGEVRVNSTICRFRPSQFLVHYNVHTQNLNQKPRGFSSERDDHCQVVLHQVHCHTPHRPAVPPVPVLQ